MTGKFEVRQGPGSEKASLALSNQLNEWFENYGPSDIFRTCENCMHMAEDGAAFCVKFQMTPPCSVIMTGCGAHEDKMMPPF